MEKENKDKLIKNWSFITENTNNVIKVAEILFGESVLTRIEHEEVTLEGLTRTQRNRKLLEHIERKRNVFDKIVNAFREAGDEEVAERLKPGSGLSLQQGSAGAKSASQPASDSNRASNSSSRSVVTTDARGSSQRPSRKPPVVNPSFELPKPAPPERSKIPNLKIPSFASIKPRQLQPGMDTCYPMGRRIRGKALIVNNVKYKTDERSGSDVDCAKLYALFCGLSFETFVYSNLSGNALRQLVARYADRDMHREADAFMCAILAHGGLDKDYSEVIYGVDDEPVGLNDEILMSFQNCETLGFKPKVFFIQACRGSAHDRGVLVNDIEADSDDKPRDYCVMTPIPTMADMLIAYPSVYGYVALRDTKEGSWFIQSIVEAFEKHAHDEHIFELLTRVNSDASKRRTALLGDVTGRQETVYVMPNFTSTLRKLLYFFPGYVAPVAASSMETS